MAAEHAWKEHLTNVAEIVNLLTEAMKAQQDRIENLERRVVTLQQQNIGLQRQIGALRRHERVTRDALADVLEAEGDMDRVMALRSEQRRRKTDAADSRVMVIDLLSDIMGGTR